MANGKLIYAPVPSSALVLDAATYLTSGETSFNFGVNDFGVDCLFYLDAAVGAAEVLLAGKGAADLANLAGWQIYLIPATGKAGLRLNDGGTTPLEIESSAAAAAKGAWAWVRVQADRSGLATIHVNGVLVGSGAISSKAGSLDNAEPLRVAGQDEATNTLLGRLNFLRLDVGRLLPDWWYVEEWDVLRYGGPRRADDFLARWDFAESLADSSINAIILAYHGSSAPAYLPGWPSILGLQEITLTWNYKYGDTQSHLDLDDRNRTLSGAARGYAGARKRTWNVDFDMGTAQKSLFEAIYHGSQIFRWYPRADGPQFIFAQFGNVPEFVSEAYFSGGKRLWSCQGLTIEEI